MSRTDYLKEYKGWVYTCVSTIASRTASLDYHVLSPTGKQIDHEYLSLITYDLIEQIASFLKLNGSCYVWKVTIGSRVIALHVLRPDLMQPVYDQKWAKVTGYKYMINGKSYNFSADEVLAFHNFNPLQTYPFVSQGVGDVQAASVAIDTDNATATWNWKFFENSARPNTAIEIPGNIDDPTRERLENAWNSKFRNVNNAHKPVFLTGGMKISDFGPSQKEMDFVESRRFTRDEIFGIFKVPKAVIGLGEGQGQNMNIRGYEIQLAMNAIEPLAIKIQEVISVGLFGKIGLFEFINVVPKDSDEVRKDFEV